ncbi:DinB family protein [Microbulbifer sp. SA54]|uniref:DinB family protein n=1 Tax=Microbulbifer sp. SA54 TaxID=3401577 RepID=UPI003AAB1728
MEIFQLMADYNQWMNEKVYSSALKLNDNELIQDRGAYFGSVLGTLNHILVGDIIWLKRFSGHAKTFSSLEYLRGRDLPGSLAETIHQDLASLRSERSMVDEIIINFTRELTEQDSASLLTYSNMRGEYSTKNLGFLVQHLFNHQTHHRGQISTLLSQFGLDIGVTDLLMCIPSAPRL